MPSSPTTDPSLLPWQMIRMRVARSARTYSGVAGGLVDVGGTGRHRPMRQPRRAIPDGLIAAYRQGERKATRVVNVYYTGCAAQLFDVDFPRLRVLPTPLQQTAISPVSVPVRDWVAGSPRFEPLEDKRVSAPIAATTIKNERRRPARRRPR